MADMETGVTDDVTTQDEGINKTPIETPSSYDEETLNAFKTLKIDPENATTDDLSNLAKRVLKAEQKKVEEKRALKEVKGITPEDLDLRDEVTEFLVANPELKEYKADIFKHRKAGFSLKQVKALIETDDKTIENRRKTNLMNISQEEGENRPSIKSSYTREEVSKLDDSTYDKVSKGIKEGRIKLS